jgi:hypothetical protein
VRDNATLLRRLRGAHHLPGIEHCALSSINMRTFLMSSGVDQIDIEIDKTQKQDKKV